MCAKEADVDKLDNPASPIKSRTANKMDDVCVFIFFASSKIQLSDITQNKGSVFEPKTRLP